MNFKNQVNRIFRIAMIIILFQLVFNISMSLAVNKKIDELSSVTNIIEESTNLKILFESYEDSPNSRKEYQWDIQIAKITDALSEKHGINLQVSNEINSLSKLFYQFKDSRDNHRDSSGENISEIHLSNQVKIRIQTILSAALKNSKILNFSIKRINMFLVLGTIGSSGLVVVLLFKYLNFIRIEIGKMFSDLISKSKEMIKGDYSKELEVNTHDYSEVVQIKETINDMSRTVNELVVGLIKSKEGAVKANNVKSEFIANISHEIRTPLSGISGLVQLLKKEEIDEDKKESLRLINFSTNNLIKLVDDLLSISKIEAGKLELQNDKVNIVELIENVSKVFELKAKQKGLEYELDIDRNLQKFLRIDEGSFWQILNNVLGNAIKFTEKGKVTFIVRQIIDTSSNRFKLELVVDDTGIGISNEKQLSIFEPFVQGEYYLTKKYEGTGLGLTITKRLVEALNGNIYITSKFGSGTKVKIEFSFNNLYKETISY